MSDSDEGLKQEKVIKAGAQVETSVAHTVRQKSGELKLDGGTGRKSLTLGVRFQAEELTMIKLKASRAGCTTNTYIRAAALDSDYKPPADPALVQTLLKLNRELTAQGNNLNQIAKLMNGGKTSPAEGTGLISILSRSLLQTHKALRKALSQGEPEPEA